MSSQIFRLPSYLQVAFTFPSTPDTCSPLFPFFLCTSTNPRNISSGYTIPILPKTPLFQSISLVSSTQLALFAQITAAIMAFVLKGTSAFVKKASLATTAPSVLLTLSFLHSLFLWFSLFSVSPLIFHRCFSMGFPPLLFLQLWCFILLPLY